MTYAMITYSTDWTGRAEEPALLFETKKEAVDSSKEAWRKKMDELGDKADSACSRFDSETGCGCAVDESGETFFFEVRETVGLKKAEKSGFPARPPRRRAILSYMPPTTTMWKVKTARTLSLTRTVSWQRAVTRP